MQGARILKKVQNKTCLKIINGLYLFEFSTLEFFPFYHIVYNLRKIYILSWYKKININNAFK